MPLFMVRSSPFWIAITSLGSIMPVAWAADPPCPSQIPQPLTPAAPAGAATGAPSANAAPTNTPAAQPATGGNIEVTADSAEAEVGEGKGRAKLRGNVEVRQGDRTMRTDAAEVDRDGGTVKSEGHIDFLDPLVHVTGASGTYSQERGAEFRDAQFSLRQRSARGTAQDLALTPQGMVNLSGVTFTTCPPHDNSWQIRARSIDLDTQNKIGTGRDARIDFMGVPLMYLPWLSFPLSSERKSGFLFPGIGNTSSSGAQVSVPYYWNIAPNADFTFEPIIYSKRGVDLGGDFRFLTERQRGELDWNYLPYDRTYGASRSRVQLVDVAELPADLRLNINAENVSDREYFEDFSQGPEGASTAFIERRATVSYRGEHWRVDTEAQEYQTIDYTLAETDRPYARVPRIAIDAYDSLGSNGLLRYGFTSEVVNFQHVEAPVVVTEGWRADVMPQVALDLTGPGYFLRPAFAWRGTQYELTKLAPSQLERSPSRTLPITSVDTGLVFERPSGSRNQRKLTLEPRILYLDVPYRDQTQLPVFDTAVPDLNPVQLFRTNRYVGADRVSDANQVSFGITSRLLDAQNGQQFIAGTFGQTYYFQTPRVTLPGETPLTGKRSDLVAQLSLAAFQDWSADAGVQWDPQNQRSERTNLNLQYKPGVNKVLNFAYRYERFTTTTEQIPQVVGGVETLVPTPVQTGFDQLEFSGAWPIGSKWSVFAREIYALRNPQPPPPAAPVPESTELERFLGFEYRSCCWRVRVGARRFVSNHDGSQDTGVWLQLELNGLAGVGSASDSFLTEEIRGYTPPGATNVKTQGPLRGIW
jgi:LPS-assembly protein